VLVDYLPNAKKLHAGKKTGGLQQHRCGEVTQRKTCVTSMACAAGHYSG